MKTIYALLFAAFLTIPAVAQKDTTATKNKVRKPEPEVLDRSAPTRMDQFQRLDQVITPNPYGVILRLDNRYEGVRGTPYFLSEWVPGRIDLVNGRQYEKVPLKYDAFSQNLILRRDNMRDSIVVFPQQVKQFVLRADDGAQWTFRRYPDVKSKDATLKDGYFMVLYDGKTSLLKQVIKVLKKADYKNPYSTDVRYDAYESDYAYYVLKPDQTLTKIRRNRKALYDALSDKGANFDAFATQEKLDFKSDTDFAKVVKYYDGL